MAELAVIAAIDSVERLKEYVADELKMEPLLPSHLRQLLDVAHRLGVHCNPPSDNAWPDETKYFAQRLLGEDSSNWKYISKRVYGEMLAAIDVLRSSREDEVWLSAPILTAKIGVDRASVSRWLNTLPPDLVRQKGQSKEAKFPEAEAHWNTRWKRIDWGI